MKVGSSDGREFRQGSGVPTSRTLTDIGGFTVLVITDVSGIHDQRPTVTFQSLEGREFRQ